MRMYILFHHVFVLCIQAFYPVSYVSELFTLFHHCSYIYVSMLLLYFTILLCLCIQVTCTISLYCMLCVQAFYPVSYVSELFTLFPILFCIFMCPCFYSISPYCYVYVSKLLALFHYTDMLCIQAFYPVSYVSGLFTLFHHIFYVCLCVQAFYSVSYVSELFTLFHHTLCMLCVQAFYPVSYVSGLFTLFHHTIMCLCIHVFVLFHHIY